MCGQWLEYLYLDKDVGGEPRHGACTLGDLFEVKKVVALTSPLHTTVVLCQNVCWEEYRRQAGNWESANNQNWVLNKT